jgi:hypothetical protein
VGAISEGFLAMDASGDGRNFQGQLRSSTLGPIGVNGVLADAQCVWRTPRGIARSREQYFYLLGNATGPWRVTPDGREALMKPGDFVLVDSRRPYTFDFASSCDEHHRPIEIKASVVTRLQLLGGPQASSSSPRASFG